MSKSKSKPKRVEYVTAASYEILSDERDALEGALTDVEQERDALRTEVQRLQAKDKDYWALFNTLTAAKENYRTMCEYRDQWAKQSAVWEEKARTTEMMLGWERETARYTIGKWLEGDRMLDAVCRALNIAQFQYVAERNMVDRLAQDDSELVKLLEERLRLANRNMFSKLWHWFTDPPDPPEYLGRDI